MSQSKPPKLSLFPLTSEVSSRGHLCIGGCDSTWLAEEYGTPLYVFDEFTLRSRCREFQAEFTRRYSDTEVIYASKAFLNGAVALIFKEEGLGLDVVSGGELTVAQSIGFPPDRVHFHGNNKTVDELKLALGWGIGRVVVDNLCELDLVDIMAREMGINQNIWLRLAPGVDPHTHRYTTTGTLDSKFGFPLTTGQAEAAVAHAMSASSLNLVGFHFHLGSPIPDTSPYQRAIDIALRFAREMEIKYGFHLEEFSPGGGFAVRYTLDHSMPSIGDYAEAIVSKLTSTVNQLGLASPKCIIEPGRGITGQAGVALYTVGAIKEIPGVRKYVCVDGGIGDNVRPALYEAKYEAVAANKLGQRETAKVTIAGRYCESGDILARDVTMPPVSSGDLIAVPVSGAYSIPMASNYNMVPRPAIAMVKDGKARLIRKRESYQDLVALDSG